MASAAIYDACVSYLESATVTIVNAEQTGLLVTGSVTTSREPRGPSRVQSPFPVSVEIVPVGPWASRAVGIGIEEVDLVFDLKIEVRKKAVSSGRSQLDVLEDAARALVRAWRNVSTLSISPSSATFRRSNASLVTLDETPDTIETARAVVRVTLTFTEAQA